MILSCFIFEGCNVVVLQFYALCVIFHNFSLLLCLTNYNFLLLCAVFVCDMTWDPKINIRPKGLYKYYRNLNLVQCEISFISYQYNLISRYTRKKSKQYTTIILLFTQCLLVYEEIHLIRCLLHYILIMTELHLSFSNTNQLFIFCYTISCYHT